MSNIRETCIDYFISLTNCSRENAIEYLNKTNWKLDESLNMFFELDSQSIKTNSPFTNRIESSYEQDENRTKDRRFDLVSHLSKSTSSKSIIIPTMIEFQRFMESFDLYSKNLLENSSKMVNLTMKCATIKPKVNLSMNEREHWLIHVGVDRNRLQILLENEMCAPLVWIEHFEHLLNGNLCQLFDCDYMFCISD